MIESYVALLYNIDSTLDMRNYRPIALTNAIYKLIAILIRRRLQWSLDDLLQSTQYSFRAGRSTADALHVIRSKDTQQEIVEIKHDQLPTGCCIHILKRA